MCTIYKCVTLRPYCTDHLCKYTNKNYTSPCFIDFYRATRTQRICIARYMPWPGVCLTVSVRLSKAAFLSKRLDRRSWLFYAVFSGNSGKIRVLPTGSLSQTLNLAEFFMLFTSTVASVVNFVRPGHARLHARQVRWVTVISSVLGASELLMTFIT